MGKYDKMLRKKCGKDHITDILFRSLKKEQPATFNKIRIEGVKEVFSNTMVEARLCSCSAIQELKKKDANNIVKHHPECIYNICRDTHIK